MVLDGLTTINLRHNKLISSFFQKKMRQSEPKITDFTNDHVRSNKILFRSMRVFSPTCQTSISSHPHGSLTLVVLLRHLTSVCLRVGALVDVKTVWNASEQSRQHCHVSSDTVLIMYIPKISKFIALRLHSPTNTRHCSHHYGRTSRFRCQNVTSFSLLVVIFVLSLPRPQT